jgi:hypothetical protein
MTTAPVSITRLAILCAAAFVVANAVFYVLSGNYFDSHLQIVGGASVPVFSPQEVSHIRSAFATSAGIVTVVSFLIARQPRAGGHVLAGALGLMKLVGGFVALTHNLPGVLIATLLVFGALTVVLAWLSSQGSRAAWGFLGAICGVFAVVSVFGAPRLRGILGVSLWTLIVVPGLYVVAAMTLYFVRHDYAEPADGADRGDQAPAGV